MMSENVTDTFESNKDSFGAIGHGYTYSAHPVGAAAAIATLQETRRLNVADNAAARGAELMTACLALQDKHEVIGDVRGIGLMLCLELVSDRGSKKPLDKKRVDAIFEAAYAGGVMIRVSGNNIILSPPLVIDSDHVTTIVTAIDDAISETA